MANQHKIIPMGRLPKVMVDIAGARVLADFEVIEIVEDADPYPMLLQLDLVMEMGGIINLKEQNMVFESRGTRVVLPIDPVEGARYSEPVHTKEELDHIYKITAQDEYWVNPMDEGMICWENDSECLSDSNEEMENWQSQLHEVLALHNL